MDTSGQTLQKTVIVLMYRNRFRGTSESRKRARAVCPTPCLFSTTWRGRTGRDVILSLLVNHMVCWTTVCNKARNMGWEMPLSRRAFRVALVMSPVYPKAYTGNGGGRPGSLPSAGSSAAAVTRMQKDPGGYRTRTPNSVGRHRDQPS